LGAHDVPAPGKRRPVWFVWFLLEGIEAHGALVAGLRSSAFHCRLPYRHGSGSSRRNRSPVALPKVHIGTSGTRRHVAGDVGGVFFSGRVHNIAGSDAAGCDRMRVHPDHLNNHKQAVLAQALYPPAEPEVRTRTGCAVLRSSVLKLGPISPTMHMQCIH